MRYPLDHPFSLPAEEVIRLLYTHNDKGISGPEAERPGTAAKKPLAGFVGSIQEPDRLPAGFWRVRFPLL